MKGKVLFFIRRTYEPYHSPGCQGRRPHAHMHRARVTALARGGGGAAELAAGAAARSAHGELAARWIEAAGAVRDGWTVVVYSRVAGLVWRGPVVSRKPPRRGGGCSEPPRRQSPALGRWQRPADSGRSCGRV